MKKISNEANGPTINNDYLPVSRGGGGKGTDSISLCMIVKNEENNLVRCLNSVKDVVDEIIIVDTGSSDGTVEIAKSFGANVYFHPWEGDFSKARNYSMKYATGKWILILDADEEFEKCHGPKLNEIVRNNNSSVVSFVVKNLYKESTQECYANSIRLIRNFNGAYYDGIVHNALKYSGHNIYTNISIIHYGYNGSSDKMEKKFIRTTTLLKKQVEKSPEDPTPHRYLGMAYMGMNMYDEAITESKMAINFTNEKDIKVYNILISFYIISASYLEKGRLGESEVYALKSIEINDRFIDGYCILSFVYYNQEEYDKFFFNSEKYLALWDKITRHPENYDSLTSHTMGHKWKVHLLRGFYYLNNGHIEKGNNEIEKATNMTTDIEDCLKLLGNFYFENNQLDKAEGAYMKLLNINGRLVDILFKMGHTKYKKQDKSGALLFWEKAVDIAPDAFDIRLLICKLNIAQGNLENVASNCNQLLNILNIPGNAVFNSPAEMADLFGIIGKTLNERNAGQAAKTAFNISKKLKLELSI